MLLKSPSRLQIEQAKQRAIRIGKLKGSITNGEGNFAGFIGEIVVSDHYSQLNLIDDYEYDLVDSHDKTWDVKTKRTTAQPQLHFLASIPEFPKIQKCHGYIFCRYRERSNQLWIIGWITKEEFFLNSFFAKKGEEDPYDPSFVFKGNCYSLPYSDLHEPGAMK